MPMHCRFVGLDDQRRSVVTQVEGLKAKNTRSKRLGSDEGRRDADAVKAQVWEMAILSPCLNSTNSRASIREKLLYMLMFLRADAGGIGRGR